MLQDDSEPLLLEGAREIARFFYGPRAGKREEKRVYREPLPGVFRDPVTRKLRCVPSVAREGLRELAKSGGTRND